MIQLSSSQKKLISIFLIAFAALGMLIWFLIGPLLSRIKIKADEYMDMQKALVELNKKEALFKELQEEYQSQQSDLILVKNSLLEGRETVGFISTIEELARLTGNRFEIQSVGSFAASKQNGDQYPYLAMQIALWGNFNSILTFLANLEDSPYPPYRLLEIENLDIRRVKTTKIKETGIPIRAGDLEVYLTVKVYTKE